VLISNKFLDDLKVMAGLDNRMMEYDETREACKIAKKARVGITKNRNQKTEK